jgi:hypothetical protein
MIDSITFGSAHSCRLAYFEPTILPVGRHTWYAFVRWCEADRHVLAENAEFDIKIYMERYRLALCNLSGSLMNMFSF